MAGSISETPGGGYRRGCLRAAAHRPFVLAELDLLLRNHTRPVCYYAEKLTQLGKARKYTKREDLTYPVRQDKQRARPTARQENKQAAYCRDGRGSTRRCDGYGGVLLDLEATLHGLMTAQAGAQRHRMKLLGAEVVPVTTGTRTLKDAVSAALRSGSRVADTPTASARSWGPV